MSIFKKDLLLKMITEGMINGFTILGIPNKELIETYFMRMDLVEFLNSKNIKCNINDYDRADIGIYFPTVGVKQYYNICSITVYKSVTEEEYKNILSLFDEILDYYQSDIAPHIINKILGLYEHEPLTFDDMLHLTKDTQSEIARKINKSRQLVADVKSGKANLTIANLSLLMKKYPLLPWTRYIEDINTMV